MNMIIGEKLGMTQVFDDENRAIPVTVIKAGPVRVTQIKRPETDGYAAVQIAYKEMASANRAQSGHFAKAGVAPHRHVVEVRVDDVDAYELGQEITIGEVLEAGQRADAAGISKGKGFAGVMKRHGFKGASASHGVHKVHRAPGSIGACATPARVFKGKRMPGQTGNKRITARCQALVDVDTENNLLLIEGSVPGPNGGYVIVRKSKTRT